MEPTQKIYVSHYVNTLVKDGGMYFQDTSNAAQQSTIAAGTANAIGDHYENSVCARIHQTPNHSQ